MNPTETFQHYQVLRRDDGTLWELGRGAMGVTYKAFDVNLRCLVALKVINGTYLDHSVARQRFIREARAAAALRHRNIAHVYHLGMDAQSFFYAMEFIDGETLDALVRRQGQLPTEAVLRIASQTARALSAAARQRLVHRDIKPTNLMILAEDEDGETYQTVKVIDFGLARSAVRGDASTHLTMGGFVGTPQYASPEQLEEKNVDGRSDIYSLGATLWYLLAGRPPFSGTLTGLITQHLTKEPPWDQLTMVPAPMRKLLARMLQKSPDDRPQSAGELRREIENCLRALAGMGVQVSSGAFAGPSLLEPEDDRFYVTAHRTGGDLAAGGTETLLPTVGSLVGGRYQVMRLAGEGSTGRVFQAHDLRGEGQTVALKVLHPDLLVNREDHDKLRAAAEKVRAAPHPGLLRLLAYEEQGGSTYLINEWSGGLTLVDLLRNRGRLTVAEAMVLLKQAVTITDFARAHGLERLELHLHQIFVVPSEIATGFAPAWSGEEAAELLSKTPLAVNLRIEPLGPVRDAGELATWAGDLTLLSASQPAPPDSPGGADTPRENSNLRCLARLFYELVEGTPPPGSHPLSATSGQALSLPSLGEAGSAILRRALSPEPGFSTDTEFFETLARAAGFEPEGLQLQKQTTELVPQPPPHPLGVGASTADAPLTRTKETTGVPPGGEVSAVKGLSQHRSLKPVRRRKRESHTLTIDLRVLGRVVGAIVGSLLVAGVVLVLFRSWLLPGVVEVKLPARRISTHDLNASPSGGVRAKNLPTTSPAESVSKSDGGAVVSAAKPAGSSRPGSAPTQTPWSLSGHEWLEDTALAQVVTEPVTIIPYAPGIDPGEEEIRIPFLQAMSGDNDDAPDKVSQDDASSATTEQATASPGAAKNGPPGKAASSNPGRGHTQRRRPPPPNFWQRLFGIKPKPAGAR